MRAKPQLIDDGSYVALRNPLAIIDASARHRSELTAAVRHATTAGTHVSVDAFDEATEPGEATIIVLGPSASKEQGLDQVGRLLRSRPEIRAIMVVESLTTGLLQHAIRSGVSDVVLHGAIAGELLDAVIRADHQLSFNRNAAPTDDPGRPAGRVTTVFSPKGGSGKSVVATNLAIALAKRGPNPVVLVDADLQFGDDAVLLHMQPRHNLADVIEAIDRLDAHQLRGMLDVHEASGILVLAAPVEPAFAERVTAADMGVIINLLRSFAAHVVIDTPSVFNDVVLGTLDRSDDILMVGSMDIPTIKNVKIALQTMSLLEVPSESIHLVLNRANTKVKVEVQEVERTLQMRADALIPSDILVPTSVNRGVPAVLDVPRSAVARSINQLADVLLAGRYSKTA
jgi:pilus assembly protein CpaE